MKCFKKRFVAALIGLCILIMILPVQAFAAAAVKTDARCSLTLSLSPDGKPAEGVEFKAYRVASVSASCVFTPIGEFSQIPLVSEMLKKPSAENYDTLCKTLPGYIAEGITEDASGKTDADGTLCFKNMPTGLYLITGEVYHGFEKFYIPEAFMVSLPSRVDDIWDYDPKAIVKYESIPDSKPTEVEVLKVWKDAAEKNHSKDVVTVELYKNKELYDTVMLSKENDWRYKWTDLYGGAAWSVKEKKFKGYTSSVKLKNGCTVISNKPDKPNTPPPIPQTGLLWWPVPVLVFCGILFILFGIMRKKGHTDEEK